MGDLIETGSEFEYLVPVIFETESVGVGQMVRVFCASPKHGLPALQFTMIGTPQDLMTMATQILEIAAGIADALVVRSCLDTAKTH